MNENQLIKIIEEGLSGEYSMKVKIRNERYFDDEQFEEVLIALEKLIIIYKDKDYVPKKLALCFVDLSSGFYVDENYFENEVAEKIEDALFKISELAENLFS